MPPAAGAALPPVIDAPPEPPAMSPLLPDEPVFLVSSMVWVPVMPAAVALVAQSVSLFVIAVSSSLGLSAELALDALSADHLAMSSETFFAQSAAPSFFSAHAHMLSRN